jgi:hypothetical protein
VIDYLLVVLDRALICLGFLAAWKELGFFSCVFLYSCCIDLVQYTFVWYEPAVYQEFILFLVHIA